MKRINLLLTCLLLTATVCCTQQANAQAPQRMSYQFVIRNSSNALVVNTQVGIQISVLQDSATGPAVYVENQTATTNSNGLVSLQIGTGIVVTGSFVGINWASGSYFIKTETDPAGGINYSITGTHEMLSVPYVMYAAKSGDDISLSGIPDDLPTLQIGTQKWASKNLDVAYYRNGEPIPEVKDAAAWAALTTGAWCWYNNDSTKGTKYGKLYNWYAVNDARGLAPQGWHIPSDEEWTKLSTTLEGEPVAGGQMKEVGTLNWTSPNIGANNSSGFSGLPGGFRQANGASSSQIGIAGIWWSSTEIGISAWLRAMFNSAGSLERYPGDKTIGYSIRCLRD